MNMPKQAKPIFRQANHSSRSQFAGDVLSSDADVKYKCLDNNRNLCRRIPAWTPVKGDEEKYTAEQVDE
jgi:hypothetical protein